MPIENIRSLSGIDTPIKLLALVVIAVEAGLAGLILALREEDRLLAFGIFGALVSLTVLTLYAIERLRTTALAIAKSNVLVQKIATRRDLYRESARLILTSSTILDTSWGIDPRKRSPEEELARDEYRETLEEALRRGKICRELIGSDEGMDPLVVSARETTAKFPSYSARKVVSGARGSTVLEFLVADDHKVLLSHVDARHAIPQYLYIESEEIAQLFSQLHSEHWASAEEIHA